MTTFTEVFESVEKDSRICDMTTRKVGIYLDALYREYAINCEEAELKVLNEGGTADDLAYLCEEATDGVIKKTIDGIKKIFETVIKFIKDLAKKIADFVTGKTAKDAVDKMEDAVKANPELGKTKVEIPDFEAEDKWYQKAIAKLKSSLAKVKGGNASKSIIDDADEVHAEIEKRRKKGAIAAGVATVTVAAAIIILRKMYKKGEAIDFKSQGPLADTDEVFSIETYVCETIKGISSAEHAEYGKIIGNELAYAAKNRAIARADSIKAFFSSVADAIKGSKIVRAAQDTRLVRNMTPDNHSESWYAARGASKAIKDNARKALTKESAMDDSYLDSILGYQNDDVDSLFDSIVESVNSDDSFSIMDSIDAIF